MRFIPLILLVLVACAFQRPPVMQPPAGLNEYAQMQDYLDCHGSWRERACFRERGYTEVLASPTSTRTTPSPFSVAHSRP